MSTYFRILTISLGLVATLTLNSFAEEGAPSDLEKYKAEAIANREKKIQKLQDDKNCFNAASTTDAFNQCLAKIKERKSSKHANKGHANRKTAGKKK